MHRVTNDGLAMALQIATSQLSLRPIELVNDPEHIGCWFELAEPYSPAGDMSAVAIGEKFPVIERLHVDRLLGDLLRGVASHRERLCRACGSKSAGVLVRRRHSGGCNWGKTIAA